MPRHGPPPFPLTSLKKTGPLYRYLCAPGWTCDTRWPDHDLWLIFKGHGTIHIDGRPWRVTSPCSFLFRPGQHVRGCHDPAHPLEVWALHFSPHPRDTRTVARLASACQGRFLRDTPSLRGFLELFLSAHRKKDPFSTSQSATFALALLSTLWRSSHEPPPSPRLRLVEDLLHAIRLDPARQWSIPLMCRHAALGPTALASRFRSLTGLSPAQFVIHTRVEHASMLLRETSLSHEHIASLCGYRDIFFFSRQFRKITGSPPAAFARATTSSLPHP